MQKLCSLVSELSLDGLQTTGVEDELERHEDSEPVRV